MNGCYTGSLLYEFDVNGHTVVRCKENRSICAGFNGNCPAIRNILIKGDEHE